MPGIVIVGTGFGGIGMGIALKQAGYDDFIILDKEDDLGGTWRDNQYPGCACDVPSPLYSYSFELNPDWSRLFAPQREIWAYLRGCARKYGLEAHIRYGSVVEQMHWDEDERRWDVQTVEHGELGSWRPRAVVSAAGALHLPAYPDIPGAGRFAGTSFHSARWDHSCDLAGKRVAVIGTGASAIQFVPEIAKQAAQLTVFQRTPPWIHPRPDAPVPARMRTAFRKAPGAARGRPGGAQAAAREPGGLPGHHRGRLPEPVPAPRPQHRPGALLGGVHDREPDPARAELPAPAVG